MPDIRLWGRANSINVQKVAWLLAELDLDFERFDAGGTFGGLDDAYFLAMNPFGRIPVLQDRDVTLWESNATVRYLAAKYGAGTWWKDDPAERALGDRWMDWQLGGASPHLTTVLFHKIRLPEAERDARAVAAAEEALHKAFAVLEKQLARQDYFGGEAIGMADVPVGAAAWRYLNLPMERPETPKVQAYVERLRERPAFAEHVALPVT